MTETALDFITSAFRKAGILTKTESPSADEANDALEALNDLIASHANDGLMVFSRTLESFGLMSGVSDYTIGPGATFDTIRPTFITDAYYRLGDIDYPLSVIKDEDYADISLKSTGSIPYWLNYTNEFPIATIRLYPVPSSAATLFLLTEKPLSSFTLHQQISLPPGWSRYLKNQLAIEIAPEYGVQIPGETVEVASRALAAIKRGAARAKSMDNQADFGGLRNVYTGWEY